MQPPRTGSAHVSRLLTWPALLLPLTLAAAVTQAQENEVATADNDDPIEEVVVTGRAQEFYRVDDTSFATKTPTPVLNVPQSVQVLTRQLTSRSTPGSPRRRSAARPTGTRG